MDLANWLVSRENPLTARTCVNRIWQQFFGVGLVKTSEDLGAQGEVPSHPQLLDYLATTFMDSGWDVKSLVKEIVMSRTYRQSSRSTEEQYAEDPNNRLLARGSRFRLDAEIIRDQILATSGTALRSHVWSQRKTSTASGSMEGCYDDRRGVSPRFWRSDSSAESLYLLETRDAPASNDDHECS